MVAEHDAERGAGETIMKPSALGLALLVGTSAALALKKTAKGWKIAGWTWTGTNPAPAK